MGQWQPVSGCPARVVGRALVPSNGLVGELRVVPPADQQPPGAVAFAVVAHGGRALLEQQHRGPQLGLATLVGNGSLDQVGRDATAVQLAGDPLRAPAVELALVLGKAPGVAGVVEQARLA